MTRLATVSLFLAACAPAAEGIRATPSGTGPVVMIDWDAEPLPEVPFPNDLSTVNDITSPTGLRMNIPLIADTHFESETREKLNTLTGFGIYAPITVRFEAPLDLQNIVDRHPNDLHLDTTFDDDAILLVNVDPDSPGFGELVHLDLGHGRYPADVLTTDRYFTNDTRSDQPSILFDTVDEDLNGNGVLDWGEDSDNDGLLDVPNVFPEGGDVFEDLLSFYDRGTDQLIVRPVVPMREATTYAVVLTERLVGEDGEPVRSPWPYVHHTRQTKPLRNLDEGLAKAGLTTDDVAFAWTFTTGTPTKDLRDLKAGLVDGEGPYKWLATEFPAAVLEAHETNSKDGLDPYALPMDEIIDILIALELAGSADDPGTQVLESWFKAFSGEFVGGTIDVPYLLADDDGDGWDADEYWKLDPYTGEAFLEKQRVPFTCVKPKPNGLYEEPYPIMFYGHGYGSNRLEVLLFAAIMNRFGFAACALDFPGHGATASGDDLALATGLLEGAGLSGVVRHLFSARFRDLDNDGDPDSGGDQWVADPFHTRDMVRQAVVDWMALTRALRACGEGEMAETIWDVDGKAVPTGAKRTSCDWNGDGTIDLGGPDVDMFIVGGSLGGINSGVAAAIMPGIQAFVPVVPAGGIVDVGSRTDIGGAVEAFVGKLVAPLIVGIPSEGGLDIVQEVNSVTSMRRLVMGTIADVPAGGKVVVTNLDNGIVREGYVPDDGRFRVSISADAMNAREKALASGMPLTGPVEGETYVVPGNEGLGDQFIVELYDADDKLVATFDSWPADTRHEGVTMEAGSPLVAGNEGTGRIRGSFDARRLAYISALVLEAGDPIAYAPHYFLDPFEEPQNVMIMPTAGDSYVPTNTGIAMARAAGIVDWQNVDERYGMTVDQWLIDRQVIRGVEERGPYTDINGAPALFDADDFDEGTDDYGAPSDAPLRATVDTEAGQSGLRIPYVSPRGTHGFGTPDPSLAFDINTYSITLIADYLVQRGQLIEGRLCMEDASCADYQPVPGGAP